MFTVELRVNGALVGHVYGRNVGDGAQGRDRYAWEYYEPELGGRLLTGVVEHLRSDGLAKLAAKVLKEVQL